MSLALAAVYKRPPLLLGSTALTAAPAHGRSTSRTDLNLI